MIAWLGALAAFALFEQAQRPLQKVTLPSGIPSLSAKACASCHPREYAQWQGSRHADSYTNRLFLAAYRRDPTPWCIYCHAPLPQQAQAALGTAAQRFAEPLLYEGINCATCHVRDGAILSSRPATAAAQAAHAMRHEPLLGRSEYCGSCHQFNFPRELVPFHDGTTPMQNTLAEWQRTSRARECQDCHMPRGEHRFPGGHDKALLTEHLSMEARRAGGNLSVLLRTRGIGHSLPTGDPFRRLRLEVCAEPDCDEPPLVLLFRRTFRKTRAGLEVEHDTTVPPPGPDGEARRSYSVAIPEELREVSPLYYRLSYAYAAQGTEIDLRPEDRSVELSRGRIP